MTLLFSSSESSVYAWKEILPEMQIALWSSSEKTLKLLQILIYTHSCDAITMVMQNIVKKKKLEL